MRFIRNFKTFVNESSQITEVENTKAGFWACYGPSLFGKKLGLKSTQPW